MNKTTRLGLFAAAIILLALALARPISERFSAPEASRIDVAKLRERLLAEEAVRREEFNRDPQAILAKIRALQAKGDDAAALRFATPYYSVNNAELTQLYRQSVSAEGRRLRLHDFGALVTRECNQAKAGSIAADKIEHETATSAGDGVKLAHVDAHRLEGPQARAAIVAYLREVAAKPPSRSEDHGEHIEGPPRVHTDFVDALPDSAALPDTTLCVWKISGQKTAGGVARPFDFTLWLAPAATGRTIESAIIAGGV